MLHCFINLRSTEWPPRSLTPSFISSFESTVPKAGHQFTYASLKNAILKPSNIFCCLSSSNAFHSEPENAPKSNSIPPVNIASSTPLKPPVSKIEIKVSIFSALSFLGLYHELNN